MNNKLTDILAYYQKKWNLLALEQSIITHSSLLQRVLYNQQQAIIKVPLDPQEKLASELMLVLQDKGLAVKVYEHHQGTLLMQYIAPTTTPLHQMALDPKNILPTKIICELAQRISKTPYTKKLKLTLLKDYFNSLTKHDNIAHPILQEGATLATKLLMSQKPPVVLHGDLHHRNILLKQDKTTFFIDPKALYGEEIFDYLPLLFNPTKEIATDKERFKFHIEYISSFVNYPKKTIYQWAFVYACLSASWYIEDKQDPSLPLIVALLAKEKMY